MSLLSSCSRRIFSRRSSSMDILAMLRFLQALNHAMRIPPPYTVCVFMILLQPLVGDHQAKILEVVADESLTGGQLFKRPLRRGRVNAQCRTHLGQRDTVACAQRGLHIPDG